MTSDLGLTQDEISRASNPECRVIDVSGTHIDALTVLKLAFGNGETEAVSLDKTAVENLVSVLKAIVPYFDAIETTSISGDVDIGQIAAKK